MNMSVICTPVAHLGEGYRVLCVVALAVKKTAQPPLLRQSLRNCWRQRSGGFPQGDAVAINGRHSILHLGDLALLFFSSLLTRGRRAFLPIVHSPPNLPARPRMAICCTSRVQIPVAKTSALLVAPEAP